MTTHTVTLALGVLEATHAAWKAAAANAEPGVPRLTFTRGMKALREELTTFQEERSALALSCARRDDTGALIACRDGAGEIVPGQIQLADAATYRSTLAEIERQTVTVSLPVLTDDLLCRTAADEESLALLLGFVPSSTDAP
jgi:hypothetical protein